MDENTVEQPESNLPAQPALSPVQEISGSQRHTTQIYTQGFHDGLLGVEQQEMETFLAESEQKKLTDEYLEDVRRQWLEHRSEYNETRQLRLQYTRDLHEARQAEQLAQQSLDHTQQKYAQHKSRLDSLLHKYQHINPPYPTLIALLFVLAAVVFIIADVGISRIIVFEVLDMQNGWESWAMALGLAAVAFVLKPFFDRIFEKPYDNGQKVMRNHVALSVVAVLAVVTLSLMGYLRYSGSSNLRQIEALERQRNELQQKYNEAVTPTEKQTYTAQLQGVSSQIDVLISDDKNRDLKTLVFIFGGVLFAASGAVCLSIGSPALDKLYRKHFRMKREAAKLQKETDALATQTEEFRAKVIIQQERQKLTDALVAALPDTHKLAEQAEERLQFYRELLAKSYEHGTLSRQSLYREGYQRGKTFAEEWDLQADPYEAREPYDGKRATLGNWGTKETTSNGKATDNGHANGQTGPRKKVYSGHLHQRIRQMLGDNFNQEIE